jgi:MYXO-CTERM domain-containing protein
VARFQFPPLPGTAKEAERVASDLPGATLLAGADATEAAVKALHAPRILHVATHGFFFSAQPIGTVPARRGLTLVGGAQAVPAAAEASQPAVTIDDPMLRSGIALAGANLRKSGDDDGVLTALEASSLDLEGTELVVLSACDTGLGDIQRGQGVFSLRRALVEAGAATQVLSLWEVDDDATIALMTGYYQRLVQRAEGRGAALRSAQLAMLADPRTAHPFYWSAFIVSGDPSPLAGAAPAPTPPPVRGARGCSCSVSPSDDRGAALASALAVFTALAARRRFVRPRTSQIP